MPLVQWILQNLGLAPPPVTKKYAKIEASVFPLYSMSVTTAPLYVLAPTAMPFKGIAVTVGPSIEATAYVERELDVREFPDKYLA